LKISYSGLPNDVAFQGRVEGSEGQHGRAGAVSDHVDAVCRGSHR